MVARRAISVGILVAFLAASIAEAAVVRIERISTTVSDLRRSVTFYREGLGFELIGYEERSGDDFSRLVGIPHAHARLAIMRLGAEEIELVQYRSKGRKIPADSKSPDLWFQHFAVIVSDMKRAYAHLQRLRPKPISQDGPQTLPASTGGVEAFKFQDPDGHPLELLHFPENAGRPVWHTNSAGRVFLGIDHSAIGISDTDASRAFYTDLLGFSVAYESVNSGPSQERLDGTLGAVVRITGERKGPDGIGIEFLDYRTPPTGRFAPVDEMTDDLTHMHLLVQVEDLDAMVALLQQNKVRFVTPQPEPVSGGLRAVLVRDPDRHEIMLTGP